MKNNIFGFLFALIVCGIIMFTFILVGYGAETSSLGEVFDETPIFFKVDYAKMFNVSEDDVNVSVVFSKEPHFPDVGKKIYAISIKGSLKGYPLCVPYHLNLTMDKNEVESFMAYYEEKYNKSCMRP